MALPPAHGVSHYLTAQQKSEAMTNPFATLSSARVLLARAVIVCVTLTTYCHLALAQEGQDTLKKVLSAWECRQAAIRSLRCELVGRGLVPKGNYTGSLELPTDLRGQVLPKEDHVYDKTRLWV